ncbi:MAG: lysophospholipid acyltransferase family protein [Bacilli bacterium]
MYYKEDLGYKYPDRSDEHMIEVKHIRDVKLDENHRYYNKSFGYKVLRFFLRIILALVAFPICTLHHGLKIYGRKEFKKNKKLYKNGAITIANHVLMWDYICVLKAIRPHLEYHAAWKTNLEGPNGPLIRLVGGVPIPTDNMRAMVKWQQAIDNILDDGNWLHFFPEGSMWFYYPDIRPLKKGIFKYAVRHNKPVIPITLSFRKRTGIYKLFGKKPCVDLHIGDPLLPDLSLPINDAIDKLHKEAYHIMQVMNGINPGDPTYNTDQNILHYQKTM